MLREEGGGEGKCFPSRKKKKEHNTYPSPSSQEKNWAEGKKNEELGNKH